MLSRTGKNKLTSPPIAILMERSLYATDVRGVWIRGRPRDSRVLPELWQHRMARVTGVSLFNVRLR